MRNIWAFFCFFLMCFYSEALALTASECSEIKDKYSTISEKCLMLLGSGEAGSSIKSAAQVPGPPKSGNIMRLADDGSVTPVQRQDNVFFTGGGSELDDDGIAQIAMLAAVLKTDILSDTCVQLVGHSDKSGSTLINLAMSKRRAQAVALVLGNGIGNERIVSVMGAGEKDMLPNLLPTDPHQRRVEIHLKRCEL